MKQLTKIFTTFIILFFMSNCFAQDIKVGDIIKLTAPVEVIGTPISLQSSESVTNYSKYIDTYKYKVLKIGTDEVQLLALNFTIPKEEDKKEGVTYNSDLYNNLIYTISLDNFKAFAIKSEPIERFSIGLLTLPFKARPQDDVSFDTEFNLSSTLNIRLFPLGGATFNFQIGAGIGSVGLNSSNAAGVNAGDEQDVATLTLLSGIMLQYRRVQVGIYGGVDQINNQSNFQWESNGNLWLGFGIGYNLFQIGVSKEKQNNNPDS